MISFERGGDIHKKLGLDYYSNHIMPFITENNIENRSVQNGEIWSEKQLRIIDIRSQTDNKITNESFSHYYNNANYLFPPGSNFLNEIITQIQTFVPIFLIDDNKSEPENYTSPDYLGFYSRIGIKKIQSIFLYPERILSYCAQHKIEFEIVLAKILIHEFGHAMMDLKSKKTTDPQNELYDRFKKYIEEPLANLIVLAIVPQDPTFTERVKEIIQSQQTAYKLAYYIFEKYDNARSIFELCKKWISIKEGGFKIEVNSRNKWLKIIDDLGDDINDINKKELIAGFEDVLNSASPSTS